MATGFVYNKIKEHRKTYLSHLQPVLHSVGSDTCFAAKLSKTHKQKSHQSDKHKGRKACQIKF